MRHLIAALFFIAVPAGEAAAQRLVPFERPSWFNHSFSNGLDRPFTAAIRSRADWERFWLDLNSRSGPWRPAPPLDFRRQMVLVAALGSRPTGGFAIRIVSVARNGNALVVTAVRTSPGRRCGTIQAVTEPADAVVVPRFDGPVRWRFRDEVTRC